MTTNDIIQDARVVHVRELKAEVARLNAELGHAHEELASLRGHLDLALLAARDAEGLTEDATFWIVDGWNALLGSESILSAVEKHLRPDQKVDVLRARVRAWLSEAAHQADKAWIVLDGPHPGGVVDGRLRVSWTGGTGAHRADRFICDYLRMRKFAGTHGRVVVITADQNFKREVERLGTEVVGIKTLT